MAEAHPFAIASICYGQNTSFLYTGTEFKLKTSCVSDYLYVDRGICKCREEGRNQYTDPVTGACFCEKGYYMTDKGCLDCQYLIPGCD